MTVIPSFYWLNWQSRLLCLGPRAFNRRRLKHILEDAAETGVIAHVRLLAHNILYGSGILERLGDTLREAARSRDAGPIDIVIQAAYLKRSLTIFGKALMLL